LSQDERSKIKDEREKGIRTKRYKDRRYRGIRAGIPVFREQLSVTSDQ